MPAANDGATPDIAENVSTRALEFDLHLDRGRGSVTAAAVWTASTIVVAGPSGAGKSTLVRMLLGLERAATGRILAGDEEWLNSCDRIFVPPWRRRCGYVPQDGALFPHLSVRDNLAFSGVGPRDDEVSRIAHALDVESLLSSKPRALSGGERQRVAIGRALLSAPKWLFFDEAMTALDRSLRDHVLSFVGDEAKRLGAPLVIVSHTESDAAALGAEPWRVVDGTLVH